MKEYFDPSYDIFSESHKALDSFFFPNTIAVIGASERENSVGKTVFTNLSSYKGQVIPINPKREKVLGKKTYPSLEKVPGSIDLVVIVTPASTVVNLIYECVQKQVSSVVIISAGFKEMGKEGEDLEKKIWEIAQKASLRIIGPNCLGIMNTAAGLNATFAADMALEGNLAFISQSGALLTAVLDWSLEEKVGFSSVVSIGSMLDVGWGDLISYFGSDPKTKSILLYMESIGNPRSFLSAAREVGRTKPIILIKAGKSEESAKAAASHTGSLSGSDEVLDAALDRVGILRVNNIADLFSMALVLSKQPTPKGPHLSIITNAGGPGVIATDALIEAGGKLAPISPSTFKSLNQLLPPHWSRNNPIDILGDASPEIYSESVRILEKDSSSEGILVILTPQDMTDPVASAKRLKEIVKKKKKPIMASWMGGKLVHEGMKILQESTIPCFSYPDEACRAFAYMWKYHYTLEAIYETPLLSKEIEDPFLVQEKEDEIQELLGKLKKENRVLLTEYESKKILNLYKIPTVATMVVQTLEQAKEKAEEIGFPVVLKLHSETITHKTDVGGVKLNLSSKEEVERAFSEIFQKLSEKGLQKEFQGVCVQPMVQYKDSYELILGSSIDAQFGSTLLFGSGGQLVEVYKDRALALPPLTTTLAQRMIEKTKIYEALKGVRGRKAICLKKLREIMVRFSHLIAEQSWIAECDINPLLVSPEAILALDARIIAHPFSLSLFPETAIRAYPTKYVASHSLRGGEEILIRPILPEDEVRMIQFHRELSENSVLQRYLKILHYDEKTLKEKMSRLCFSDYNLEIPLVVQKMHWEKEAILAVSRLSKIPNTKAGIFSLVVQDAWQGKGIGTALLKKILEIAKEEGVKELLAKMLPENEKMLSLCKKFGFSSQKRGKLIHMSLQLH